jgi:hypothetical protein
MDIIQRNLFKVLRNGAFNTYDKLEPMSAHKWERLYQLAVMHNVIPYAYKGIENSRDQFFMHLTERQEKEWQKAYSETARPTAIEDEEDEFLRADHLTNPMLNRQLQNILDDEHSDTTTRHMLLLIIRVVRHILNEGMPIRQLLELGIYIKHQGTNADYKTLKGWLSRLRLTQMAHLEWEFLILMFGFTPEDIPFLSEKRDKRVKQIANELLDFTNTRSHDWYFSQDEDSIFVHNSNTSAMFSHVRRSARYFRYYPSESVTNFFASFVHSLSHIEE